MLEGWDWGFMYLKLLLPLHTHTHMLWHQTVCTAAMPRLEPCHTAQGLTAKAKNHEGKEVEYWGYGGDHGGFAADAQVSGVLRIPLLCCTLSS